MNQLVGLTLDLQLVLVAGYLAYKTSTVGKTNSDRTEDFIFKVLAYGLVARALAYGVREAVNLHSLAAQVPDNVAFLLNALCVVVIALVSAVLWRSTLSQKYSSLMKLLSVYTDDHQSSTWDTLCEAKTRWDCVQVHLASGIVLESHFSKIPETLPLNGITLNADGVAMYVNRLWRTDGSLSDFAFAGPDQFNPVTYVPRDQIKQIDISWKSKPTDEESAHRRLDFRRFVRLPWSRVGRSSGQ